LSKDTGSVTAYSTGTLNPGLTQFIASKDQEIERLVRELEAERKAAWVHPTPTVVHSHLPSTLIFGLCSAECAQAHPPLPTEIPGKQTKKRDSLQGQLGFLKNPDAYREFKVPQFGFSLILRTG
jgi:hypothetical protein